MSFALWTILMGYLLAYFSTLYAKTDKRFSNASPRIYLENLEPGPRQRSYWAHKNTLEMMPLYSAAVIIATIQDVDPTTLDLIAAGFIFCRLSFIFAYILDLSTIRSIVWAFAFGCIIGLFLLSS